MIKPTATEIWAIAWLRPWDTFAVEGQTLFAFYWMLKADCWESFALHSSAKPEKTETCFKPYFECWEPLVKGNPHKTFVGNSASFVFADWGKKKKKINYKLVSLPSLKFWPMRVFWVSIKLASDGFHQDGSTIQTPWLSAFSLVQGLSLLPVNAEAMGAEWNIPYFCCKLDTVQTLLLPLGVSIKPCFMVPCPASQQPDPKPVPYCVPHLRHAIVWSYCSISDIC